MPEESDNAARLLDRPADPADIAEATAHCAESKKTAYRGAISVLIFRLGEELFGLSTELLQEAIENCPLRTLPHQRSEITGLAAVRGELLVCVSLPALLGIESTEEAQRAKQPLLLVLNQKGGNFAFAVDEICGIHRYDADQMLAPPATLGSNGRAEFVGSMLPWQNKSAAYLDGQRLSHALDGDPE